MFGLTHLLYYNKTKNLIIDDVNIWILYKKRLDLVPEGLDT